MPSTLSDLSEDPSLRQETEDIAAGINFVELSSAPQRFQINPFTRKHFVRAMERSDMKMSVHSPTSPIGIDSGSGLRNPPFSCNDLYSSFFDAQA